MPNVLVLSSSSLPLLKTAKEMAPKGWRLNLVNGDEENSNLDSIAKTSDFILVFGHSVPDHIIRTGGKIKLIQLCSAGFDGVNIELAQKLGIPVATNGGANSVPVAEFTITLMLGTIRHLIVAHKNTINGNWMTPDLNGYNSYELYEKTVGIIGAGRIGTNVIRILSGFRAKTLYYDHIKNKEAEMHGAKKTDLATLLSKSDIVSVHIPLTKKTKNLIGTKEFSIMKPKCILINTSRGEVVDEKALVDALTNSKIWGAGLDVFSIEPTRATNPLFALDNVVSTPHIAGKTSESYPRRLSFAFENMLAVWNGKTPKSEITLTI
tara:strand:- start:202 stop:1167 length:966 start_codon:yes stop_codon:yes gene_type:complete